VNRLNPKHWLHHFALLALLCFKLPQASTTFAQTNTASKSPAASAEFLQLDSTTQGNWKGHYGSEGYVIINDATNPPPYVKVTPNDNLQNTWAALTRDASALQKPKSDTDRIAAIWYRWANDFFTINLNFTDHQPHQVSFYFLDWYNKNDPRATTNLCSQKVEVLNTFNRVVLDSRTLTNFRGGQYLTYNLSGNVTLKISGIEGDNCFISALFFDPPSSISPATNSIPTQPLQSAK
jgi:hypothetical protein